MSNQYQDGKPAGSQTDADRGQPPGEKPDGQLVSGSLAGDSGAYDQLVRRYQRRAVAVAYRLLGDIHDASDVAQDAFLRGVRSLESLQDRDRFGPWLLRIVSNLALNFRRARHLGVARQAMSLDDTVERMAELKAATGESLSPDDPQGQSIGAGELTEAVRRAIEQLPEHQRLALVLSSLEGMPQKEVAHVMEISPEMVKWNVFQARKALKQLLADHL